MTKEARMTNHEYKKTTDEITTMNASFGLRHYFVIRASSFGIQSHSCTEEKPQNVPTIDLAKISITLMNASESRV